MPNRKIKLLHSGVEIEPFDYDFSLTKYPASYLTKLILKANELGLAGKKVETIEVGENFSTGRKYIDLIEVFENPNLLK